MIEPLSQRFPFFWSRDSSVRGWSEPDIMTGEAKHGPVRELGARVREIFPAARRPQIFRIDLRAHFWWNTEGWGPTRDAGKPEKGKTGLRLV